MLELLLSCSLIRRAMSCCQPLSGLVRKSHRRLARCVHTSALFFHYLSTHAHSYTPTRTRARTYTHTRTRARTHTRTHAHAHTHNSLTLARLCLTLYLPRETHISAKSSPRQGCSTRSVSCCRLRPPHSRCQSGLTRCRMHRAMGYEIVLTLIGVLCFFSFFQSEYLESKYSNRIPPTTISCFL